MPKLQPAVMNLLVNVPASYEGEPGTGYLDLSQCASILNRRFYRQGLQWVVQDFQILQSAAISSNGRFTIEGLPLTWVCSNAWHKSFAMWKKQQDEVMEDYEGESAIAKFRDFKIFMDGDHVEAGFAANLLPVKSGGGTFTPGEWDPSQIVVPNYEDDGSGSLVNPAEFYLHMVGASFGPASVSRGIIDGYQYSRSYPQSPDPVSPSQDSGFNWMRDMFNVGNNNPEVAANASDNNDELPYPQVDYPGGDTQAPVLELRYHTDIVKSGSQSVTHTSFRAPGGMFPSGLIKFSNNTDQVLEVMLNLVPGDHRGYLAAPMQDM